MHLGENFGGRRSTLVMLVTAVTERALKSPCDAPDLEEAGGRAVGLSSGALAAP